MFKGWNRQSILSVKDYLLRGTSQEDARIFETEFVGTLTVALNIVSRRSCVAFTGISCASKMHASILSGSEHKLEPNSFATGPICSLTSVTPYRGCAAMLIVCSLRS